MNASGISDGVGQSISSSTADEVFYEVSSLSRVMCSLNDFL